MSKKKEKGKKDAPIDYQLATKNLQYTIVIKDTDIDRLKNENICKKNYILSLEQEISKLKAEAINVFELEKKLRKALKSNENLQKQVDNFNDHLMELDKKNEEEKKRLEHVYQSQINHLRVTMDAYIEKVKLTNQLLIDKEKLENDLEEANNKNKEIISKNKEALTTLQIKNGIKFTNLKNKMTENIIKTKNKVTELNLQYMDVSSKLTLLQNHQLLIQLEYQTQQIDDLKEKNKTLEKTIYDLSKEIEIHKEVEISLAEKNKNLSDLAEKSKNKKIIKINTNNNLNTTPNIKNSNTNIENNYFNEEDKALEQNDKTCRKTISFNNIKNNQSNFTNYINVNNSNSAFNSNILNSIHNGSNNNNSLTKDQSKILNLERKIFNLNKKLLSTKKECIDLKDKNEYIERVLQNYENKYSGLFNYLEECLNKFFNDEELKNNKEIYVNIDSIQKGDFSKLNKEEKYSTLIILMKYLMPLMSSRNCNNNSNSIENISLKFRQINPPKKILSHSNKKKVKKYIMNTSNNFYNNNRKIDKILNNNEKQEFDPLPSIRKISLNGSQLFLSKKLNKNKTNENIINKLK